MSPVIECQQLGEVDIVAENEVVQWVEVVQVPNKLFSLWDNVYI